MDQGDHERWWRERGSSELRELLYSEWDPIGLGQIADAPRDEYEHYAGGLARRLRAGSSEQELAVLLEGYRADMGLERSEEIDLAFARRLRSWYAAATSA